METKASTKIRTGTVSRDSLRTIVSLLQSTHAKAKAVLDAMDLAAFDGELSFNGGNVGDNYADMLLRWASALETAHTTEASKPKPKKKTGTRSK